MFKKVIGLILASTLGLSCLSTYPTNSDVTATVYAITSAGGRHEGPTSINYNGHSYYVYNGVTNSWKDAKKYCEERDGYLAVINSKEENQFLYNLMTSFNYDSAYFGYAHESVYSESNIGDSWLWVNNSVVSSFENWAPGEPSSDYENYAMFYSAYPDGTWNDGGDFDVETAFICEWDHENAEVVPGIQTFYGHSYYLYSDVCNTWEEAKKFCEDKGGYLAVINNNNENTALFNMVKSFGYKNVYFGYTDKKTEGNYSWVENDSSTYENWGYGEPNGDDLENYAMFYQDQPTGQWNDGDFCENGFTVNSGRAFICEWDSADPPIQYEDGSYELRYTPYSSKIQQKIHISSNYNLDLMSECYNSTFYYPNLSYLLSIIAASAYTINDLDYNLRSLEFEDYSFYNYYTSPIDEHYEKDNCAYSIAKKQTTNGDTIVLVAIRGSYGGFEDGNLFNEHSDWNSNVNVYLGSSFGKITHSGFNEAMEKIYTNLLKEIGGNSSSKNIKFFITGHSRGAGVGNLLAKKLCDSGVPNSSVFDYNFACPDVARDKSSNWNKNGIYDNIYNINAACDPVCLIPGTIGDALADANTGPMGIINPRYWGKYGNSFWFSKDWSEDNGGYIFLRHAYENYVEIMSMEQSLSKAHDRKHSNKKDSKKDVIQTSIKTNSNISEIGDLVARITDLDGKLLAVVSGSDIEYYTNDDVTVNSWIYDNEENIIVEGKKDINIEFSGTNDSDVDIVVVSSIDNSTKTDSVAYYEAVTANDNDIKLVVNNSSKKDNISIINTVNGVSESIAPDYIKPSYKYGDINTDESINIADAVCLQKYLLGNGSLNNWETADLCSDCRIDVFDMVLMRRMIIEQLS